MGTKILPTFILTIMYTAHAALTNCISPIDNCLCVWDLPVSNIRHANGQYRLVSQSSQPTSKKWIMTDIESPQSAQPCHSTAKMFWYASACAGRWYLGDDTYDGQCTGNCFCNANGISDPLSTSCPMGKYDCFWQVSIFPPNITHVYDKLTVTFGRCPQITNTCDSIKLTASSPRDICNGIYNKIDYSPTGLTLDNEINIYVNPNQTVRNRFVYYDHHVQRWVCSEVYKPCSGDFEGKIIYIGTENDPGTPDPFKSQSGITVGSIWTVQGWSNDQNDPQSVPVIFECYAPDNPTTTITPTTVVIDPSSTQTDVPTVTETTNQPSQAPTDNPTTSTTYTPTYSTTNTPTTSEPSAAVSTTLTITTKAPPTTTSRLLTTSTTDTHTTLASTTNVETSISSTFDANHTRSTTKTVTDIPTTVEKNVSTQTPIKTSIETSVTNTELEDELNAKDDGLLGINGLKIEYVAIFIVALLFCLATICCCCAIIFWFRSDNEYDNKNDYNQTNKMIKYETTNQEEKKVIDDFEYYE